MSAVGVRVISERVCLRIDDVSLELTLGEAMSVRNALLEAVDLLRDDRSVVFTLADLVATLPSMPRKSPVSEGITG